MLDSLGSRIKSAMKDANLTATEVAKRLGTTPQAVYGWVKTGRITKENLSKLALLLSVSTDWLAVGRGYTPSRSPEAAPEWSSNSARMDALNIGRKIQTAPTEVKDLICRLLELSDMDEEQCIAATKAIAPLINGLIK